MATYKKKQQSPQIYILDASAGTGKTYSLAKQYLKLLFHSAVSNSKEKLLPKNILAITFTNKAAIEMKQRILELLKRIALNFWEDKKEIKQDLLEFLLPNHNARVQPENIASTIINEIIKNYHYFQVQTIDSFVYTIASLYAFQLNLSPNFKVETEHDEYLHYCIENLIDTAVKNNRLRRVFENFIDNYLNLENKKSFYPKKDILEVVKSLYEQTTYHGNSYKKKAKKSQLNMLFSTLGGLVKDFYEKIQKEHFHKYFISAIEELLNKYNDKNYQVTVDDITSSKFFLRDTLPVKKNFAVPVEIQRQWISIRKLISEILELYCFSVYDTYIDIFNYVEKALYKITLEQNIVFLSELNRRIQKIMASKDYTVPELYMRMATTINHCLIDEFQDTSVLQWTNLNPIVSEILATGGTLFYVGDKKQAIYRYRGGDYRLFDMVPDYYPMFKTSRQTLDRNFRSAKSIVQFNNIIFSQENLQNFIKHIEFNEELAFDTDVKSMLLKVYENSKQQNVSDEEGYVYGELLNDENSEDLELILKQKILSTVEHLIENGYKLSQIGILVRKNPQGELVSNWLLERGYPVESDKTLDIQKNSFVKEIISLLKYIVQKDELSFVSFILGNIFSESTDLSSDEIANFVFSTKKNKDNVQVQFKLRYADIWNKFFEPILRYSTILPISELLIKIYEIFNLGNLPIFKSNYPFFYKLLDLAAEFEDKDCSIQYFIERFEALSEQKRYITAKGEDSIHVMTIHKAKGLEFDIVILPFVNIEISVGKQKDTGVRFVTIMEDEISNNQPSYKSSYLLRLTKTYARYSPKLLKLYSNEYIKTLIDELNVLYVAFTRAKKQLYFYVKKDKRTELLFPWSGNCVSYGKFEPSKEEKTESQQGTILQLPTEHISWYDKLAEERVQKSQLLFREQILKGNILHKILSFIGNLYGQNVEDSLSSAIENTKLSFNLSLGIDWEKYKKLVLELVNKEELRNFFFIPDGTVFCEQEIVDQNGETKRPDRVIIKDHKVIVVDYKLTVLEEIEKYKQQLLEYKSLLHTLYSKPVEGYIIFIDTAKLLKV